MAQFTKESSKRRHQGEKKKPLEGEKLYVRSGSKNRLILSQGGAMKQFSEGEKARKK